MTAWLPSGVNGPVGSSLLLGQLPPEGQELEIRPWKVTALRLLPAEVISLLTACAERRNLVPKVVLGSDILFWAQALRFTGSLAARGPLFARGGKAGVKWLCCRLGAGAVGR